MEYAVLHAQPAHTWSASAQQLSGIFTVVAEAFEDSPEHEDWIEETGGSDEKHDYYYQKWHRRVNSGN